MSVIGPRPLLVEYLPYYTKEEHHRHDVRPGLSGWAQINGTGIEDSETKKLFTVVNDRMDKIEKLVRRIQEPKNKYGYTSLNYKNAPEKIDTYYIENIEDEIEKLELEINYQNLQDKDTIKRLQLYKNRLDKTIGDGN